MLTRRAPPERPPSLAPMPGAFLVMQAAKGAAGRAGSDQLTFELQKPAPLAVDDVSSAAAAHTDTVGVPATADADAASMDTFPPAAEASGPSARAAEAMRHVTATGQHQSLLRLFDSEFFNMTMAMTYLNRYPDAPDVQAILCDKISGFPADDIEFYLPQFLALFIYSPQKYSCLRAWLLRRCQVSVQFAMLLCWLIDAELHSLPLGGEKHKAIMLLRDDILTCVAAPADDSA